MTDAQVPNFPQDERVASAPGVSAVQSIAVDATGGTFTVTFEGGTTAAIKFNATPVEFEEALEVLPALDNNKFEVTGGPGNAGHTKPYVITFKGGLANQPVGAITTGVGSLTGGAGTAAVTQTVAGKNPSTKGVQVGTGLANRNAEANPLEVASPAEKHTTNSGSVYE